ncbi:Hsp70 family protein [Pseudooceanicola sp.]|uniref:Hsp70 family protein n=1 Tax=Pseudooceanicola sp. TaxID=1914328 RepID=UPI002610FF6E|nr:Hsp70 family protein [Pseudooceanicola sp.]MDF1853947.1 Hsp70 family protein [Pseudooceanicola sp.]
MTATTTLAIDFGTSNSAMAVIENGQLRRLPAEPGSQTLPTAVFFPADKGAMRIGAAAGTALIEGEEGRYMRALKSVLGDPLLHESRLIGGKRRSIAEVITAFLATLRSRAEAATGQPLRRALSGRPVHFHTRDAEKDAQAEADLRACYLAAGFDEVAFLFEPEAAALASHSLSQPGATGLIVDIGGGTSDFSVFRVESGQLRILASHGIRLGGTDFDRAISLDQVMPELGRGGTLRREFGSELLPVPAAIYADLATWARIPLLYSPETRRKVDAMLRLATDRRALERLATVLRDELGHDIAFAVERGKIAANAGAADAAIALGVIETGLQVPLSPTEMAAALARFHDDLHGAAAETLTLAGIAAEQIGSIILVGGSSLMQLVPETMRALCPGAAVHMSEAFTAVVDGLALATAEGR